MLPDLRTVAPWTTLTLPVKIALLSFSRASSLSLSISIGASPVRRRPVRRLSTALSWAIARPQAMHRATNESAAAELIRRIRFTPGRLCSLDPGRVDMQTHPLFENDALAIFQHLHGVGGDPRAMRLDIDRRGAFQAAIVDIEKGGFQLADQSVRRRDENIGGHIERIGRAVIDAARRFDARPVVLLYGHAGIDPVQRDDILLRDILRRPHGLDRIRTSVPGKAFELGAVHHQLAF